MEVIRAEVGRDVWVPPPRRWGAWRDGGISEDGAAPFGSFAKAQVLERRGEVRPATSEYREWALRHLLSFFGDWPLPKIDVRGVDAYRTYKLEESEDLRRRLAEGRPRTDANGRPRRPLSSSSINKTIEVLRWFLSFAVEYDWIETNPAVGRRRRIKFEKSPAPHLESARQIATVLGAAGELDADPEWLIEDRLPVIATLVFAGLRAHELAALHWGDLDFGGSLIHVRRSKTPAGIREVKMLPALQGQLLRHRDRRDRPGARELVFKTRRGGVRTKDNVRLRILAPALVRAGQLLEVRGLASLPHGIGPHSLRHTFASVLFAIGEDPVSVMRQLGHTDSAFTLRVYAHSMSGGAGERERLIELADGYDPFGETSLGFERDGCGTAHSAEWVSRIRAPNRRSLPTA